MELGLFIVIIGLASIGFIRRSYTFLGLGIALFFTLAVFFFTYEDVIVSEVETFRDMNGTLSGTITHETPIINSYHQEVGWVMMFLAFAQIFLLVLVMFSGMARVY